MPCSKELYNLAALLTHWLKASVLYLAVGIGLITRCVLTEGDAVCGYKFGGALIALLLWMIVVSVYSLHLHSKHQRMLESRATDNADK